MLIVDRADTSLECGQPHQPDSPAGAHPERFAILGNFALDKPENRALVDTWKQR